MAKFKDETFDRLLQAVVDAVIETNNVPAVLDSIDEDCNETYNETDILEAVRELSFNDLMLLVIDLLEQ